VIGTTFSCVCGYPFRMLMYGENYNKDDIQEYLVNSEIPDIAIETIMEGLQSCRYGYFYKIQNRRKCPECGNKIIRMETFKNHTQDCYNEKSMRYRDTIHNAFRSIASERFTVSSSYIDGFGDFFNRRIWRGMVDFTYSTQTYARITNSVSLMGMFGNTQVNSARYEVDEFRHKMDAGYFINKDNSKIPSEEMLMKVLVSAFWKKIMNNSNGLFTTVPNVMENFINAKDYIQEELDNRMQGM